MGQTNHWIDEEGQIHIDPQQQMSTETKTDCQKKSNSEGLSVNAIIAIVVIIYILLFMTPMLFVWFW